MEKSNVYSHFTAVKSLYSPIHSYSRNYHSVKSMPSTPFSKRPKESVFALLRAHYKARSQAKPSLSLGPVKVHLAAPLGVKRPAYMLKYERSLPRQPFKVV